MVRYTTNEFKNGLKLLIDGEPMSIVENEMVKPGKGQAFNRVKLRNLRNSKVVEKTFKSGESVEGADVLEIEAEYLYYDGEYFHFMDPETFEQYMADKQALGENQYWLVEQNVCTLILFNGEPISVIPPKFVIMQIEETDPGVRGDTAGTGGKPATLSSSAVVRVPLFVQEGEWIKVDTRKGEYISRVKE